jgi:hypothetical protein
MTEEEINAELDKARQRIRHLNAFKIGPVVEPVIHYENDTEPAISDTLVDAFREGKNIEGGDYHYQGELVGVSVGGALVTREAWRIDPRNPQAAEEIERLRKQAEAARAVEETERVLLAELKATQQRTEVALFHGDKQITDWVPFADGKIPATEEWLEKKRHDRLVSSFVTMRTRKGHNVAAEPRLQEHVVTTYTYTWTWRVMG